MARIRLDEELVSQGYFDSADTARRAIMAGLVSADGRRLDKPGEAVEAGTAFHVKGHGSYVSRGGLKLERGLEAFGFDASGMSCLDIGCSTGGFTDCLLKHGAARVTAVDVGYAQFDWGLRNDPRIELLERTNIRELAVDERAKSFDLAVCDISFTSVTTIMDTVAYLLAEGGSFLTLVKPQFEAERGQVGPGGIVRDPELWLSALEGVAESMRSCGMAPLACCTSPIEGAKGNREFLMLGTLGAKAGPLDLASVALRAETVCA